MFGNRSWCRSVMGVLILFCAASLFAQEEQKKPWKNKAEGSFVSANGNSKSATYAFQDLYNYDWTQTGLELIAGGMGSESQGSATAEKYFSSEKVSRSLTDRDYLYEKAGWDKDRFAGIDGRLDGSLGYGRKILMLSKDKLDGEVGAGYVYEDRTNEDVNKFTMGRLFGKYTRVISPTSEFLQTAEYIHNFEDKADYRVNTETALTAAISVHFSMKLSYKWHYVGRPPTGFGKNDTITAVALVASY